MMQRRRRSGARGPSRTWVTLSGVWAQAAITSTTATALLSLEAPTALNALTSDPPEDLTVLRIVGQFSVTLSAASRWVLALVVQDATWTPAALFGTDADKRILWSREFEALAATTQWRSPGVFSVGGTDAGVMPIETVTCDIAPKVKVECGKTLYLVAYEITGAASLTTGTANMRLLFQRSRRR